MRTFHLSARKNGKIKLDCLLILESNILLKIYSFLFFSRHELYFAFACIWSFGSAMFQDQLVDWRNEFSKWWVNEFKTIKFPSSGTIFSYFIDKETKKLLPWSEKVSTFELDMDIPLQVRLVFNNIFEARDRKLDLTLQFVTARSKVSHM